MSEDLKNADADAKAYADAVTAKTEAEKPAPAKAEAPKPAPAAKAEAKPAPVAKKAPVKKAPAKKAPTKKAAAKKAAPVKKAPAQPAKKPAVTRTAKKTATVTKAAKPAAKTQKEKTIMTTTAEKFTTETKKAAEAMTERMQSLMSDLTERAKGAYERGSTLVSEASEFSKGNVEALVESGKIAAKGAQDMGQVYAEDVRKNFEELTASLKELAAVKSPTEFVKLQGELTRKGFDTMVAQTSKNTEAAIKLAGDVFQPISNRVSVAMDSFKKAA